MITKRRIVGTAGHIDHGKTSLVRALTGIDADRLPEEKRRGITIDLGFAHSTHNGVQIGFIDVPGHERFVKNMLAGVGGIDAVMLVVAADESIKPQTREHFDICRLLGIREGLVAVTKSDLVDADVLDVVRLEIAEMVRGSFLEGQPMVAVSSSTGAGLEELRAALLSAVERSAERDVAERVFRLPIDRAFSLKGFGSVVTGTTVSGTIARDSDVEVLPERLRSSVRSIEVHGQTREQGVAGERTSLNLPDLQLDQLYRGQQLVRSGTLAPSQILTVEIELLAGATALREQSRIRFHHYASEVLGRVRLFGEREDLTPGSRGIAQIRLETPVVAVAGDRFIIRRYSPSLTIGGGRVLDAHIGKLARNTRPELLRTLSEGTLQQRAELIARLAGLRGVSLKQLVAHFGLAPAVIQQQLGESEELVTADDGVWLHRESLAALEREAMEYVAAYFKKNRVTLGLPKSELTQQLFAAAEGRRADFLVTHLQKKGIIVVAGDRVDVPGRAKNLSGVEGELARTIEERFKQAGLQTPAVSELIRSINQKPKVIEGVISYLVKSDVLVRLADGVYVHRQMLDEARERLKAHAGEEHEVAWFKELFQISRKIVIPLLEWFDRKGATKRLGDRRQILHS